MKKFITLFNKIINEYCENNEFISYKDVFIKIDKNNFNKYRWRIFDTDNSINIPGTEIKRSKYLFNDFDEALDDAYIYIDELTEIINNDF